VHGIFVETRLRKLLQSGNVNTRVVAPVPWFPFSGKRFGEYGKFAATPRFEQRNGVEVFHPRYFLPPKVGMNIAPHSLARAFVACARRLQAAGYDFDLIDAHYYYPDGVAAGIAARILGKPFVVTARGSDLNLIANYAEPRRLILQTAAQAHASIGVCQALVDKLEQLGAEPAKLRVLRNGVDLEVFFPEPRLTARARLGIRPTAHVLLSVGNLVELKGHHLAIEAMAKLAANSVLYIVGEGPERERLQRLIEKLRLSDRVHLVGAVANAELKWWYSAADLLTLCSSREGWANVLLEAMACGTPVVATAIAGTAEVVRTNAVGRLFGERSSECLLAAIKDLQVAMPTREQVRHYAEGFDWAATTQQQIELFTHIITATTNSEPGPR
jgi:glycosyltransferase involved in cell wall biosynthesis